MDVKTAIEYFRSNGRYPSITHTKRIEASIADLIERLAAENTELRRQVDELQVKLNLEKCPACDMVERYLQLKQAAQAIVDFQKCHVMHIPNHYQCEEGCIILVTHVRQGLIDNLAAVLSEENSHE